MVCVEVLGRLKSHWRAGTWSSPKVHDLEIHARHTLVCRQVDKLSFVRVVDVVKNANIIDVYCRVDSSGQGPLLTPSKAPQPVQNCVTHQASFTALLN